ncbi:MAG: DUF6431 domain-containing protein [Eubacteriales bacterium]|nr:DUF6431 domain-containing protein [Eubacteriales bacterium]
MVIIKDYFLEPKEGSEFFYVRSREISHCPYCKGAFKVIGSRKRVLYQQDGTSVFLIIRRLRCISCLKISHELPDRIIPYKRYETSVIAAVLTEAECAEQDCSPCENSTVFRWKLWFFLLREYFENFIRNQINQFQCKAIILLPLYPLKRQHKKWLNTLIYHLVNENQWEQTRYA